MYLVFIVGIDRTQHYAGCVLVSVFIQYFTLASVMWMTATCMFLFWIMVVNPFAKAKFNSCHMLFITVLCWGKYKNAVAIVMLCLRIVSLGGFNTEVFGIVDKCLDFPIFKCSCSPDSGCHSIGYRQRLGHCSKK